MQTPATADEETTEGGEATETTEGGEKTTEDASEEASM